MNPGRLVVRLAAVSALNNFGKEPWPTIAGNRVFDSRIEPVEDFKHDVLFPVVIVYTDYDKDHWFHHAMNVNEERLLTVTIELLIAQISEIPDEEGGGYRVSQPNTDSELEMSLDIFEMQLAETFLADNPAANCWRFLMQRYVNVISRRGATVEGGAKLAARQITVESQTPRGPANGTIPVPIADFLDALEDSADYGDRVQTIRNIYTGPASLPGYRQLMRVSAWNDQAAAALGYTRTTARLPVMEPIVWLDALGRPLGL